MSISQLAIFGGSPRFSDIRPIGQLSRGDKDQFKQLIREIYQNKRFTNNGPLVTRLERELASFHDVEFCISVGNASLGLILLMDILSRGKKGEVLMPSFTYPGLPHLAIWAGQSPVFCDVDLETHTLDLKSVELNLSSSSTAILGVQQFNHPCSIDELDEISTSSGVPVFYDSVHGVGSTYKQEKMGRFGEAEVFSLHATKLINGFEGGYVTTKDKVLAEELINRRNFGIDPASGISSSLGMNAKLNEFHAAMALCSLQVFDEIVARNKERVLAYEALANEVPGVSMLHYQESEQHNFEFAILDIDPEFGVDRDILVQILRAENALCRAYYSPSLDQTREFSDCVGVGGLPNTELLTRRFIQMPVGEKLSVNDVGILRDLIGYVQSNAAEITTRYRKELQDGK